MPAEWRAADFHFQHISCQARFTSSQTNRRRKTRRLDIRRRAGSSGECRGSAHRGWSSGSPWSWSGKRVWSLLRRQGGETGGAGAGHTEPLRGPWLSPELSAGGSWPSALHCWSTADLRSLGRLPQVTHHLCSW